MEIDTNDYDRALLKAVKAKLPEEINPVWFIMDTLSIGKEAAYRRLRGEVPFTLKDAALLSKQLDISLHEVVNRDSSRIYYYGMYLLDFEMPGPEDYRVLEVYLDNIRREYIDLFSQLAITANMFPPQLYLRYKGITRFAVFKWLYHSGERQAKAYHQVKIAERMQQVFRDSWEVHQCIRTTYYLFDRLLCRSLVQDLRYFSSVGLLRDEDREAIRLEAHKLLDYMEQVAIRGRYENGNEVHMYVSDIHFNKSFYNLKAGRIHLSAIETCVLNNLGSTEKTCYDKVDQWIQSRRRLSTLISQSCEPQRIAFFNEQRQQLNELTPV